MPATLKNRSRNRMESRKVKAVLMPYTPAIRLEHTVAPDDKLTHAVKVMLSNGITRIAVTQNGRPIGMIRLDDALEKLGLR